MPKKRLKPIPRFKTEALEREFWVTQDTTDYRLVQGKTGCVPEFAPLNGNDLAPATGSVVGRPEGASERKGRPIPVLA